MKTLYLCGAGNPEGVRLALTVNEKMSKWDRIVILDDDASKHGTSILDVEIAGPFDNLANANPKTDEVSNMVARTTKGRLSARRKIESFGLPFATLVHPHVDMRGITFEGDITVYENVSMVTGACLGEGSVILMGAIIGHGSRLGNGCVVAPGAVINARVQIGDGVYIGSNASILPDLNIGAQVTIGLNTAVIEDIPTGATAMGVPAQILTMPKGNSRQRDMGDSDGFVAPRTHIEEVLAELWGKELDQECISINDNIFDLGAQSLSAVQVAFQIEKRFEVKIPLPTFFSSPTVAKLAKKVEEKMLEQMDDTELEGLLDTVERLSDDEAGSISANPGAPQPS